MVTVYAGGKIFRVEPGQRSGDFLPSGGGDFDLAVKSGVDLRFVGEDYVLQEGDTLIVSPRGVAG